MSLRQRLTILLLTLLIGSQSASFVDEGKDSISPWVPPDPKNPKAITQDYG